EVYSAIVPKEWPIAVASAKHVIIVNSTTTNRACFPSGKSLETDWKPVLDDFKSENASTRTLSERFQLPVPYSLVDREAIMQPFQDAGVGGWGRFYTRYPASGGYIEVSAVGFDEGRTRAMVYVAHHCGGLCGGGTHHFVEKVEGRWRPATLDISNCVWAS